MDDNKDKKLTAGKIAKAYKISIARKVQAGETGLIKEIEYLKQLEAKENQGQEGQGRAFSLPEDVGIPERLRIKRNYTVSAAALEQRRNAANQPKPGMIGIKNNWKTGKYAKGFVESFIKPCKSTCPNYPCALVDDGATQPGGICMDKAHILKTFQAIQKALTEKTDPERYDDINEIVALKVAGAMNIVDMLMEDIIRDGTIIKSETFDGFGRVIGHTIKPHPSLAAYPKLLSDLGMSLHDLQATPKAIARQDDTDKGVETLTEIMGKVGKALENKK